MMHDMEKTLVRTRVVLADQVCEMLKERILDQAYAPGMKLNIDALVREFAVSSTPIREALARLAAEGLVQSAPFVGFAVAALPGKRYYEDLYAFRTVIEPWAAAEAAKRRTDAVIAVLREAVNAMQRGSLSRRYRKNRSFTEADDRFHRAIIGASGNVVALRSYADLRVHLHTSRLFINREQDAGETATEHRAILDTIAAGQPEAAAQAMRRHLRQSRQRLID